MSPKTKVLCGVTARIDVTKLTPAQIKACKADFRKFLRVVWHHLGLPDPTPIQYSIAYYLQHGPKRSIICGFRGVGKSWITSAFVIWLLWRNPDDKILVISASKVRADDFSTFTLKLIKEIPFLAHLRPGRDQRESKISFDVGPAKAAHAPSVKSAGITGQITGSRANHIIADDVEVVNNSATADMRDKLMHAVSEFEAILVPEGNPRITFLGTPQTEESIYNKLAERGYEMRIWPALFPAYDEIMGKYRGRVAPEIISRLEANEALVGAPTDPMRFNALDLAERQGVYGKSGFALQFMLDTSLSDANKYPLKTADLLVMDLGDDVAPITVQYGSGKEQQVNLPLVGLAGDRWFSPMYVDRTNPWQPYEGRIMSIDPSGRGQDETAYAVVCHHHGKLYVPAFGGFEGGYDTETLVKLVKVAQRYKVNRIVIESNFGDGMFTELLKPVLRRFYNCTTEEVRSNTQKEARIIDTLEPVMNQHRLVFDRKAIEADLACLGEDPRRSLFYQMTRLTRERGALKKDDRIDVLAMGVAWWVSSMGRSEKEAAAEFKQQAIDNEIEKFLAGVQYGSVAGDMKIGIDAQDHHGSIFGGRKRLI